MVVVRIAGRVIPEREIHQLCLRSTGFPHAGRPVRKRWMRRFIAAAHVARDAVEEGDIDRAHTVLRFVVSEEALIWNIVRGKPFDYHSLIYPLNTLDDCVRAFELLDAGVPERQTSRDEQALFAVWKHADVLGIDSVRLSTHVWRHAWRFLTPDLLSPANYDIETHDASLRRIADREVSLRFTIRFDRLLVRLARVIELAANLRPMGIMPMRDTRTTDVIAKKLREQLTRTQRAVSMGYSMHVDGPIRGARAERLIIDDPVDQRITEDGDIAHSDMADAVAYAYRNTWATPPEVAEAARRAVIEAQVPHQVDGERLPIFVNPPYEQRARRDFVDRMMQGGVRPSRQGRVTFTAVTVPQHVAILPADARSGGERVERREWFLDANVGSRLFETREEAEARLDLQRANAVSMPANSSILDEERTSTVTVEDVED